MAGHDKEIKIPQFLNASRSVLSIKGGSDFVQIIGANSWEYDWPTLSLLCMCLADQSPDDLFPSDFYFSKVDTYVN